MITGEGRKAPNTDQDRADLLKSMVAYTGMYRIEGDKWITKVDVSGNPAWVGTEQARFFRFDGQPAPREHAVCKMGGPTRKGDGSVHSYVGTCQIVGDTQNRPKNIDPRIIFWEPI